MKVRSIKNYFLLIALAAYVVLYKLFIFQNYMKYSEIISASFIIVLLGLSIKFLGFRKDKSTVLSKNVMRVVIFYLFLVFFVMYGLNLSNPALAASAKKLDTVLSLPQLS